VARARLGGRSTYDEAISSSKDNRQASGRNTKTAAPFNLAWIIFFALLIFSSGTLDDIWHWVQGLPVVLEVIVWILTFPYMLALAVWESDWVTWLRIALVILISLVWTGMFNAPNARRADRQG